VSKNFMAFATDDSTHAALVDFARELYWPEEDVFMGGIDAAVSKLSSMDTPEYIFVDLASSPAPLAELDKLSGVCDPGTQVIAIGEVNDISVFREMLDAGIADYLLKPVDPNRLKQAYENAHRRADPNVAAQGSAKTLADVIVVVGARGGVGASMVACNMAWILGHETNKKVGLVDLDPYYGNIAMALNLDVGRGLSEALEAPDRIDAELIERTMTKEHDNLRVLGAEESLQNEVPMDSMSIETLIEKLRESFQIVVVEAPRGQMPAVKAAMRMATHIIFTTDYSVAGMRDVIRLSGLANSVAAGTKQIVVVNQGIGGNSDVNAKDFEATTGLPVDAEIPADAKGVSLALNAGSAISEVSGRSPVAKALRKLCTALYPAGGKNKAKKGGFMSVFSKAG
jgi:pilus assembly protein CpaE